MRFVALTSDAAIIAHAIALLRLPVLSVRDQPVIEHAIGLVSIEENCTRACAAHILHNRAFPG